ncbi:MAG: RNA-binding S4 domain-containing protein [Rhodobacteraceae bacterium]|nr:RNA-binding S4 domain-containing protein [Paracoccaceae bacterium]
MKIRIDKWLWHARFFKTRTLASKVVQGGHVRVNGQHISKRSTEVAPDDVLTFPQGRHVRVIKVISPGERRGPAAEAQTLFEDLDPPKAVAKDPVLKNPRFEGRGRPTKKDRRALDLNRDSPLE